MFIKLYCIALPIFFGMDMVWLGVAAKNFYTKQIGFLMTPKVNWAAAILFYLLFLSGLVVFVIAPAVAKDSWVRALLFGALVRPHHLRDLRSHQSCHAQRLAACADRGGHELGHGIGRLCVCRNLLHRAQVRPMTYYATLGVVLWGYMSLWFLASLIKRRNDVADVGWGLGFVLLAWTSFSLSGGSGARGLVVGILVSIWGLRLAWHIHARHRGKPEDFRYLAWRREWGKWFYARSYAQVYLLQGALLFVVALPVLMINRSPGGAFGFLEVMGVCVWLFGFLFESVGDAELCAVHTRSAQSRQDTTKRAVAVYATPQLFRRGRAMVGHLAACGRRSGRLVWHCRAPHHHFPDHEGFRDSDA